MGIELDTSRIEDREITDCTNPYPQKQVKTDTVSIVFQNIA